MKEHNGAELNTQTVGVPPNPPPTQQFDARGENMVGEHQAFDDTKRTLKNR